MTTPPSHPQVSVEETENGYIVHAGSAVATISKTILGYAVDADSQILKEEYDLSPLVTNTRKSARDLAQLSKDTDDTRLILRASRSFLFLSHAVEMVCGFLPTHFPRDDEWKLLSAWRSDPQVPAEPDTIGDACVVTESVDESVSSDGVSEELGTTFSDIVQDVDEAESEYQSNSWKVIPNKSAEKILDKSAFEYHETGVPKDVCDFFGATNLPSGSRKPIYLISNSKRLIGFGYIIKDMTKSGRVKLRWDHKVSDTILRSQKKYGDKLSLVFLKMSDLDTYNIIVRKVVGANPGENNTIPSVVEETRSNTESDVLPSQNIGEEYSPDVLRIHEAVSKLPRYRFDDSTEINVKNGLLVVFEDGEKYGEYDRIVYVGINKKSGRLPGRVHDLVAGNKDGVVLRKYIGESLLRKDGHSYARIWAKDSSSPEGRRKIGTFYDPQKQEETEARVTSYLKKQMSFSAIEIPNSTRRSLLQSELVSTLQEAYSQSSVSSTWLGRYHSDPKIRSGALWMIGNANSRSFNKEEVETFLKEIQNSQSGKTQRNSAPAPLPEVVVEYKKPITENKIPVTKDVAPPVNEEPTLYDVLQMEDTSKREQILLTAVKYHLRTLGVENKLVHVLSAFLLSRSCTKSKIYASFGAGYKMGDVTSCIDQLLLDRVIDVHQCRRFIGGNVLYYTMIDRQGFVSDLIHKKDEAIKVFSECLENIIEILNRNYSVTHSNYKLRTSHEYDTVSLLLIDPIISLGLTDEVTRILVYLHLFEKASESEISQIILHDDSDEKCTDLLRYLHSINWITTNSVQKKVGHTYKITQFYSLAQSLEDILIDYVLSHAERLEKSSEELKLIVDHVETHPFINPEVYVVPINWDNAPTEIDNPPIYCDTKLQYVLSELEESITSRLIQYRYDVELARIILNLLLNRKVRTSELSPILQQDDNNAKDFIEDLINTKSIIVGKSGETTSETYYQLSISTLNFGYKILESFESEVRDAENSLDKVSEIEKKFVNSSIEGWIKPQYLPEFNELSSILCSFGIAENVAKTLVLLSVKPISTIQDIVTELNLEESTSNHIKETLLEKGFIVEQTVGTSTHYHIAHPISTIISSYIGHIREDYEIEKQEFIDLIKVIAVHQEKIRHKRLRRVFFSPFYHPLRSYTKVTEQVYDLKMKKDFPDVRVCLVELLPTEKADLLYASSLEQVDLDSDKEILLYGYYKEYEQYVVWDFSPSYEVLKMRDLTVPTEIFDPVAGQDKVLLKTLSSGANIITCPVNKPYQAIKYWYEKKQEKEEEDSWFK